MNNEFFELSQNAEKKKTRKYKFYLANLIYQWISVLGMVFYMVAPFIFKGKVGPITYFSNLLLIPLFSVFLYYRTKLVIKTKSIPEKATGGFIKRSFNEIKDLMPSMVCTAQWISFATFETEAFGSYSWLTWGLFIPILFFTGVIVDCQFDFSKDFDDKSDEDEVIDWQTFWQIIKPTFQKRKRQIKEPQAPIEPHFKLYIANLVYQWICLAGMILFMAAPFIFKINVGMVLFHCNFVLIPILTVILFKQTKAAIEDNAILELNSKNKFKEIWNILVLMLPSIAVLCEWGNLFIFLNNSLGWFTAIIILALLPILFFVVSLCYISYKSTQKENINE